MLKKTYCLLMVLLLVALLPVTVWAELEEELQTGEDYYTRFQGQRISINVYNWGEYISDGSDDSIDINKEFTNLTGIGVNYTNFATNEEMYARLQSGGASYDIIIPSDYMIGRLMEEEMLEPLNFANIPNFENIDEDLLYPPYDPENLFSVPYTWGYVGIIYNTTLVDEEDDLETWDILWDERYLGEILMFSNSRDAFAIAQAKLGYSLNTTSEQELRRCLEELKIQKPLVQAYVMDEIFDKMLGGEAALAPYYAGDAVTMIDENDDLDFALPREGTNLFVDAMCIPKGSRQKEAAEMYINFMLEPEIGAANADYIGYATPNLPALELLDEEVVEDPVAYPATEALENTEKFAHLPVDTNLLMDRLWTELLSSDENYNRMLIPIFLVIAILISIGLNLYRHYKKRIKNFF